MSNKSEEFRIIKRYSESLKRQVVEDVDSGKTTPNGSLLPFSGTPMPTLRLTTAS